MAEKLEKFEFGLVGPKRKYPWDEWFDGSIWRLKPEVDFVGRTLRQFQNNIHVHAHRHGYRVKTWCDGEAIVMQATPKEADGAER